MGQLQCNVVTDILSYNGQHMEQEGRAQITSFCTNSLISNGYVTNNYLYFRVRAHILTRINTECVSKRLKNVVCM